MEAQLIEWPRCMGFVVERWTGLWFSDGGGLVTLKDAGLEVYESQPPEYKVLGTVEVPDELPGLIRNFLQARAAFEKVARPTLQAVFDARVPIRRG